MFQGAGSMVDDFGSLVHGFGVQGKWFRAGITCSTAISSAWLVVDDLCCDLVAHG